MRYGIFDTETTSLPPDYKAIEIALIEIDLDFNVLGEVESLLNPEAPIHPSATAVHGFTNDMLLNQPTMEMFVRSVLNGRLDGEWMLIGHRISFDRPLFAPIGNCVDEYDTVPLAQELLPDLENHKLETLKDYFGISHGTPHRAMSDVRYVLEILPKMLEMTGRTLAQHLATPRRVIHKMPFGKHAGKPLHEVPKSYRQWMLKNSNNMDANLKYSLEQVALTEY